MCENGEFIFARSDREEPGSGGNGGPDRGVPLWFALALLGFGGGGGGLVPGGKYESGGIELGVEAIVFGKDGGAGDEEYGDDIVIVENSLRSSGCW